MVRREWDVAHVMGNATERFVEGVQQQVEEQNATAQSIQETWHGISHISWTQQGRLTAHRTNHRLITDLYVQVNVTKNGNLVEDTNYYHHILQYSLYKL